jgi:hypothetical protein
MPTFPEVAGSIALSRATPACSEALGSAACFGFVAEDFFAAVFFAAVFFAGGFFAAGFFFALLPLDDLPPARLVPAFAMWSPCCKS